IKVDSATVGTGVIASLSEVVAAQLPVILIDCESPDDAYATVLHILPLGYKTIYVRDIFDEISDRSLSHFTKNQSLIFLPPRLQHRSIVTPDGVELKILLNLEDIAAVFGAKPHHLDTAANAPPKAWRDELV